MVGPKARKIIKDMRENKEEALKDKLGLYYTLHSALGAPWTWIWMIGARGRGKSYQAMDVPLGYRKKLGADNVKIYWLRLSESSAKTLLANKGAKAIEPKLIRKYKLTISVRNNIIYDNGKPLLEVGSLVSSAKVAKGSALFDSDFIDNAPINPKTGKKIKRKIFIILDEFMIAEGVEKKPIGSPVDQFKIWIESLLRDQEQTKGNDPAVRILCCANNVSECSGFMAQLLNFIPTKPGRYWLTRKHTLVDNIINSEAYIEKRKRSIGADILDIDNDSNYTNIIQRDLETLIPKTRRLKKVTRLIKFSKDKSTWFCVWDGNIIKRYKNQTVSKTIIIPMRRYLDEFYNADTVKSVIDMYDARAFKYADLVSQAYFADNLKQIKKQ